MVELDYSKQKLSVHTTSSKWPLLVSLTLFFAVTAVFSGFEIYLNKIKSEIVDLDNLIKMEIKKINPQDESLVVRINDSILSLKQIVDNHSYFSGVLDFVSSVANEKTYFERFDADKEKSVIQLTGSSQNYSTLAKQIVAMRDNENVRGLEVSSLGFGTSGVSFGLLLTLDPKVFIKK